MIYAQIENGAVKEYPLYEGDIRLRFPNVSFPVEFVPPEGYVLVTHGPHPRVDYTKNVTHGTPKEVDGVWVDEWEVTDASPEEVAGRENAIKQNNKATRNDLLTKTDWTQLGDVNLTADCKTAFAAYRQALRDLDMLNPTWPDAPAEEWVA